MLQQAAAPRSWLSSSSSASGDKEPAMPIAPRFARPIRCGMVSAVVIAASSATAAFSACLGYERRCCLWSEPTDVARQVESTCPEAD